ncbi:FeoC-like transcriptional regulator [Candidatus Thiosymbion oneisti]|uniref:FeoC-like transcriptional regulator n=1 Tax=Candidatus Thiosymbion oneisti TaxID=589554 RepID=UPI000B7CDB03|nr:FeoC-like transcriptional regulator [Candidatus Thiosymbion oneisti]
MILSELTAYLAEQERASLIDLSHRFGSDPEALRGMLAILERKGRARRLPAGTTCGGCSKCDPASIEIYEWVKNTPR